ncbi:hypothetical protein ACVWW5_001823 [Bradyrhizobium sp. LM3.4]
MLGQLVLSGISQGAIYALVALGMTVLYRTTAVLNFGYGDTFMLGAFVFYVFLKIAQVPFAIAALMTILVMIGVGPRDRPGVDPSHRGAAASFDRHDDDRDLLSVPRRDPYDLGT